MATPLLLVLDDIAAIATVRRLVSRHGYDVLLAATGSDATTLFRHHAPALVVLGPSVEGGRGADILRELVGDANGRPFRLVLLGQGIDGVEAPVAALPLDGAEFLELLGNPEKTVVLDPAELQRTIESAPIQTDHEDPAAGAVGDATVPEAVAPQQPEHLEALPPQLLRPPTVLHQGAVSLEELACRVVELATEPGTWRLDLETDEGRRELWISEGTLLAARSSLSHESLLDRARQDGLIDSRQRAELRLLNLGSGSELVATMRSRGYVRDSEVIPLLKRHAEQIAVAALSEPRSTYRITEAARPADTAASAQSVVHLVCEGLRRGLSPDGLLSDLGGLSAVPDWRAGPAVPLDALDFSSKERALLSAVDGKATVQDLLLGSGLKQEQALWVLAIARALELVELHPGEAVVEAPALNEVDERRLVAKYEELDSADYFTLLGLPRSASRQEVEQAFRQLSAELNPLRYAGHPDPEVLRQAEQVRKALKEAVEVLRDDAVRRGYAENLVD
jgi:CheY-like chemotaxis protein